MVNNKPEYRLSPKARADMETVWLYSLGQWGQKQTERYVDDLTEAFEFLAERPSAGVGCDNIRVGYRKHPVIRHVIYYRKTNYGVEVMRVLHNQMLATRHF